VTVDAYAHCGQEKYLPVEALDAVMDDAGVACAVLCQHLGQFDNSYIASLVGARPHRFAGVALVDHTAEDWQQTLLGIRPAGLRGLRVTSEALRDCPAMAQVAASVGLHQVLYAPEGIGAIAKQVRELASTHPEAAFVISHLGNPGPADTTRNVLALADLANVFVLLSGLAMFCAAPFTQLDDLIETVVSTFGPERVMWGSNFPVCGDTNPDYLRELQIVLSGKRWGIDVSAAAAISDTTARRLWFL
jgi:L-fuconolactonase